VLWNNYIAAVNGALRHVAAREALPVVDYEGMMLQLPTAHAHSRDGFHPQVRGPGLRARHATCLRAGREPAWRVLGEWGPFRNRSSC